MEWDVRISGRAGKQATRLPPAIRESFELLLREMRHYGPVRSNWRNFGKLKGKGGRGEYYHCHLNSSRPRYVAVWRRDDAAIRLLEVRYVGTHEGVDYAGIS